MSRYRRVWVPGGTYFFTVNLLERRRRLLIGRIDVVRAAFTEARKAQPFHLEAIVVLPDHLHCIWRLPDGDADNAGRWRRIKSGFARRVPPQEYLSPVRRARGERGIWQRRYWEHLIRDDEDYRRHVEYIHYNPVKHGYVTEPRLWPYSSFRRWVAEAYYPDNWGSPGAISGRCWVDGANPAYTPE